MKSIHFILLTLMILYSCQVSHQNASQETDIASSQTWPEENSQDAYKEEDKAEEEIIRRPRGKRRRRLRKRQRTHQVDEIDRTNSPEQSPDNYYGRSELDSESVTVEYPRRRPGKRRRRPYRRYQDENSPQKPLRRRRKGGRKKIRPEIREEIVPTEIPYESIRNEDNDDMETTTSLPKINPNINENLTEEKIPITEASIKEFQTTKQLSNKDLQDRKLISNTVRTDKDEINIEKPTAYGNKIFDRKKLFSNSRRMLPVTSAVIRRLSPNSKTNTSDIPNEQVKTDYTEQLNVNTVNITDKNKMTTKLHSFSEPYIITTEIIQPEKLIEEMRKAEKKQEQNDSAENDTFEGEEPNYPKIIPKPFINKSKVLEITTNAVTENIEINQTESPTTSLALIKNKSMEEEFEKMIDNLDLKTLNLTNFNDYILELLKTKSGKDYLSKLLESRNMTLAQLLEHREKGSSQFHLFEIFPQKKNIEENSTRITTSILRTTVTSTSTSSTTPKETLNIIFPSEEVVKSFPKFITDDTENHRRKIENEVLVESTSVSTRESREPRLFESMPEFTTTTSILAKKEEKPTWRVIPNPKFRPVSVRGNYEEIPVSHILNKPLDNNVNDIYIVDEIETRANKKHGHTSGDGAKKDSFGSFRKIPVGVKSAIIISGIILAMATFGFLSLLISCRVRQRRSLLRAKQDLMCEHLQNEDFMASQQSLSPVLTKHQHVYSNHHNHDAHSNPNNRHYYLWRTIRRTFRYD
ncbi:uncharacterized protein [Halyomorpha halys]|uniref:uncharacterized protein n=1 Tax=Halyomorpha halys TaxID=286706 RepID=UPI0006D4EC39|nr:uncharacterized protein LOC106687658 [Halyomorpha halys]